VLTVGLLGVGIAGAKSNPDRAGQELAEATARARSTTCTYDADAFAVRCEDGNITYLSNFWDEYQRAPKKERKAVVERWANMVLEPPGVPETLEEARGNLLPRVKSRFDHYYLTLLGELEGKELPRSDLVMVGEGLAADVVYDLPDAMMSLNAGQAEAWGTTPEVLLEVAVGNLRTRPAEPFTEVAPGVFAGQVLDSYDAARLLLVDDIAALPLTGAPVVLVPIRDYLVVTGKEDAGGLMVAAELATEALQTSNRFVSGVALTWDGEAWRPFMPPAGHVAEPGFRTLSILLTGQEYTEQRDLLEKADTVRGGGAYRAKQGLIGEPDKGVTFTVLELGPTSLPRADYVAFAETSENVRFVPWAAVVEILGVHMVPESGVFPPRWTADPSAQADTWDRLKERSTSLEAILPPE